MRIDWSPLERELQIWRDEGLTLPIWWRDDDAIAPTRALEQLSTLSQDLGLPVHLAIIPKDATQALADNLERCFVPVVHGWAHLSHAPHGEKKAEFGAGSCDALQDAQQGLQRLKTLFGARLCPMFVPPWNRIGADVTAGLADLGYRALSTFTPRSAALAAPGLLQINTHLDPIAWRGSRSLVPPETLITQLCVQLKDRREGRSDATEPYGILTHHLVHDDAIWNFTHSLLARLLEGPSHIWSHDEDDA